MSGGNLNPYIRGGQGINVSENGEIATASPTPARLFITQLATDETIVAESPTAPDTFPTGQPAVLLSIVENLRQGRTLITGLFSMSIENNDPTTEYEPRIILFLYLDGDPLPLAHSTYDLYSPGLPANLIAFNGPGSIETVIDDLEAGEHTFELRWGVQGAIPAATAYCWPSLYDCATLKVQEV